MTTPKLTKTQQELYDAMKAGVVVKFVARSPEYYWRSDTYRNCTVAARSLLVMDIAEKYDTQLDGAFKLRIKPNPSDSPNGGEK